MRTGTVTEICQLNLHFYQQVNDGSVRNMLSGDGSFRSGNKCVPGNFRTHRDQRAYMEKKKAPAKRKAEPVDGRAGEKVIESIRECLGSAEAVPSITELIRLFELRREVAQPQSGPMTVRWVDECQTSGNEE
jgi:hypothetical protein